jgi:MFS family permease
MPYASVFMLALGMNDLEVGIIASIYMFSQMICAFLSGAITDRLGRRFTTAAFDFLAWSMPCLIWAFSEGFWFFAVAALLNGTMKITTVSWDCLLVEDAQRSQITQIYSLVIICGNLSALFAPISSILVSKLTLVPAIRILYINAFVFMTVKLFILYKLSKETDVGLRRKKESENQPFSKLLRGYGGVLNQMLHSRGTVFAVTISVLVEIVGMINATFWQIIASKRIGVPDALLPIFPMVKSFLTIFFFFAVIGRIRQTKLKRPLLTGFICYVAGQAALIIAGGGTFGYICLGASLVLESFASGALSTLRESIVAIYVDQSERSRVLGMLQTIVMLASVPFGYIGGYLSSQSRVLPFVLNIALLMLGAVATARFFSAEGGKPEELSAQC